MKRTGPPKRKTRLRQMSAKQRTRQTELRELTALIKASAKGCERCGAGWWDGRRRNIVMDAHHIWGRAQGGPDAMWNLALLCRHCHDAVTFHTCVDWFAWTAANEQEARGIRATLDKGRVA